MGQSDQQKSLILAGCTVVLLAVFSIPSIPGWWAVLNLPRLEVRMQETERQLATEQDALEKLKTQSGRRLMSGSGPAQNQVAGQIRDKTERVAVIRAARDEEKRQIEIAQDKIPLGPEHSLWKKTSAWFRNLLEIGGFLGALLHIIDAVKRIKAWVSVFTASD